MQWIAKAVTTALSLTSPAQHAPTESSSLILPAQQATTFALVYGFPLLSYSNLASKIEEKLGAFQTNAFYHQTQLANASFTDINRPNLDTLYSEALVDLSASSLIVTIPEVLYRFFVFPIYDVYGNNIVNIGTTGVSRTPGRYLISYRPADPGYSLGDEKYQGYIYLPTPYGAIDLRIQVNGTEDVGNVNDLQVKFTLAPVPLPVQLAPKLTKPILFSGFSTNIIEKLLQLTARLTPFNLPEVGSDITRVTAILQLAGLSRGSYSTPSGVNLTVAALDAAANITSVRQSQFNTYFLDLGKGWSALRANYSGDFKEHYLVRAFVAAQGYLQLKAEQAIYPAYNVSGGLTSDKSYIVRFSGKPPVKGFWSLTVYNQTAYLVDNTWNIYSLGDRSGIKYWNGSFVYPEFGSSGSSGSGSSYEDGEFTILLQTLSAAPPVEYQSNWIPTPSTSGGGKPFNFNLRWYGPTEALLNGTYEYPTVRELPGLVTKESMILK